jgi:hypothetical protein
MRGRHTALAMACLAFLSAPKANAESILGDARFSGFGTLGAVHSSSRDADHVDTIFQPNGAGVSRSTSFNPDSKLGVQLDLPLGERWSAVVQVISQHQYDNSYTPGIEWANVKYKVTPDLSVRVGRIALPSYLLSETRFVGYSSPWVRPPVETYNLLTITNSDGIDASWHHAFGSVNNTLQGYAGTSTVHAPEGTKVKAKREWGFADSVEMGDLTLRAGYAALRIDLSIPPLAPLYQGLNDFAAGALAVPVPAFQAAGRQAQALAQKYHTSDVDVQALTLGATYDPGRWFLMGEYVDRRSDPFIGDSKGWYVSGGYRLGTFTPYASYAKLKVSQPDQETISTTGADALAPAAAALSAGVGAMQQSMQGSQHTVAVGLRWDFMKNLALKLQYDRLRTDDHSHGQLAKVQPTFDPERAINLTSVALDFVF